MNLADFCLGVSKRAIKKTRIQIAAAAASVLLREDNRVTRKTFFHKRTRMRKEVKDRDREEVTVN